ncbi:MAG: isoleucine--tRNA ligase [Bifidobacteriaceae bacterium]|jgi:isoleucyl-tRNA synthetase|nr:isoleucine--tRNA ligase [Bifidobacteriaceae bacterium]
MYPLASVNGAKNIPASPNLVKLESEVLDFWDRDDTFQKSLDLREAGLDGSNEFVFYDGPPFANGLPHYGHLLTGYAKDVVPRFKTMRGFKVNRVFGWDCHGLPAELEAEAELGIENKSQIDQMGIKAFNEACRKSVLRYTEEWRGYVKKQARWVDFDHGYKTLDLNYMESIIWAFKELYQKDLVYEGFRVLPYCWHDQTPLSNHELRMDEDVYQDRVDHAVTVGVKLENGAFALFWTTTPWTLPSNMLVAVGLNIDYVTLRPRSGEFSGKSFVIAKSRINHYVQEFGDDYEILAEFPGRDLVGMKFYPIFNFFERQAGQWEIVEGDFVSTEEGTGLVHMAPYGEDDMVVINRQGLTPTLTVDEGGLFTSSISSYQGQHIFEANPLIAKDVRDGTGPLAKIPIEQRALLLRYENYHHSYPHCWRCRNPLIYKPVSSWFVNIQAIKQRLSSTNRDINWIPDNVKDGQFGKWLENARDWSISRNRYWGSPIPIWVSDNPEYPRTEVYGSIEELEQAFGTEVTDLHRPFIDDLVRPNPDDPTGQSMMRRIPDVLDCWFDSGSMSFAQKHYPFENQEWFNTHFPGDFVVEYIGQTRGWFYTLHIMAVALFDTRCFNNCMCHGIILGDDGQKMSKSLRNYPDVEDVFGRDGSDAMRWFLMSSPILRGGNLKVTETAIREATRQVILPFWSAYYFFSLYANAANSKQGYQARHVEVRELHHLEQGDKYILAKTRDLVERATELMDQFNIPDTCELIKDYLEVLNNWYIRTNRERFWREDPNAFNTLWTCLVYLTKISAPLLPMVTEVIYQGLTGAQSVHLTDWPDINKDREASLTLIKDVPLVEVCDLVREIISSVHSIRKAKQIRVRQPLSKLTLLLDRPSEIESYIDLIKQELNVQQVELIHLASASKQGFQILETLTINARSLGPKIGGLVQSVIQNAKAGNWFVKDNQVLVNTGNGSDGPVTLANQDYSLETHIVPPANVNEIGSHKIGSSGFALLDLAITDELEAEGYVRDLIRDIQDQRKAQNLQVTDRINLKLIVPPIRVQTIEKFFGLVQTETLARFLDIEITESHPGIRIRKL